MYKSFTADAQVPEKPLLLDHPVPKSQNCKRRLLRKNNCVDGKKGKCLHLQTEDTTVITLGNFYHHRFIEKWEPELLYNTGFDETLLAESDHHQEMRAVLGHIHACLAKLLTHTDIWWPSLIFRSQIVDCVANF